MKGWSIYELVVVIYSRKRPQVQYARYLGLVESASSSLAVQTASNGHPNICNKRKPLAQIESGLFTLHEIADKLEFVYFNFFGSGNFSHVLYMYIICAGIY